MYRLLIIIAIMFSTSVLAFDSKPGNIDVSNLDLGYSYVRINTFGTALGMTLSYDSGEDYSTTYYKKRKTTFILQGVGFVIKEGYIVTAAHVVHPFLVYTIGNSVSCTYIKPIKVLSKIIMISSESELTGEKGGIPAEIYHLDIENDLAILKYDKDSYDLLKPIPFKMGYTREREYGKFFDVILPGQAISTIVRKRNKDGTLDWNFEVRDGKVTSNKVHDVVDKKMILEYSRNEFLTDVLIISGDSGSPAFMYESGKPVVVGVFVSTYVEGPFRQKLDIPISTVVRIDSIKNILESK